MPPTRSQRVLVVDDDHFTRVTLTSTVRALGFLVVAHCGTASEALHAARAVQPDIALLDLDLGAGPSGIDLAHALQRDHPAMGIVMLSSYAEPRLMGGNQQPVPEGVVYVTKASVTEPDVLARALHRAAGANPGAAPTRARAQADTGRADDDARLPSLTDPQVELMRLVAAGYTNAEIARRRDINEASVEKAVARLARHFDIRAEPGRNQRVMITQLYNRLTGGATPHDA